jgi:hypothetical protein
MVVMIKNQNNAVVGEVEDEAEDELEAEVEDEDEDELVFDFSLIIDIEHNFFHKYRCNY